MIVKLFDIQNGELIPTEHCYALGFLKVLMTEYPDTYMQIYILICKFISIYFI
jgi:hypothetical protein